MPSDCAAEFHLAEITARVPQAEGLMHHSPDTAVSGFQVRPQVGRLKACSRKDSIQMSVLWLVIFWCYGNGRNYILGIFTVRSASGLQPDGEQQLMTYRGAAPVCAASGLQPVL